MNIILGVDPGLEDTGWAVIEDNGSSFILKDFGLIKTPNSDKLSRRLKHIYEELFRIINNYKIKEAAIEEIFFINKIKTQTLMTQARGVILLAFENAGIKYYEYNPRIVKKTVTGNGNASKKQIENMIKLMFSMDENIYPDTADAIAIAITHLRLNKINKIYNDSIHKR